MSRKKKLVSQVAVVDVPAVEVKPQPKRYTPPGCSMCAGIRPKSQNYSEVYATVLRTSAIVRYIRCRYCGNTFKDAEVRS